MRSRSAAVLLSAALLFLIAVGGLSVAFRIRRKGDLVSLPAGYFALVRDCESATAVAVAGESYLSGGAGYLLEEENAVVLAAYSEKEDAEFVQTSLRARGVETRILFLEPERFFLRGGMVSEKRRVEGNAEVVDTCARILFDAANGLERTEMGQEEAKTALRGVAASLRGLTEENGGEGYLLWNTALLTAARRGAELAEGIVLAKDLRYLQVALCLLIVDCADYFA